MAQRPPTKPPVVSSASPQLSEGAPSTTLPAGVAGGSYLRRIKTALATISEKSHASTRAILDCYFRFISPKMDHTDFPRTLRVHPRDAERSTEGAGSKPLLLYFHVGNAIKAYQGSFRLGTELVNEVLILEARVALLESFAAVTLADLIIDGDDAKGFRLLTKEQHAAYLASLKLVVKGPPDEAQS